MFVAGLAVALALLIGVFVTESHAATPLTTVPVVSGLSQPLFLTYPPQDTTRLFVIQRGGLIRIIKNGSLVAAPFMNINSLITTAGSEQGLLGLAFHPQYAANRFFYLNYTRKADSATVVSRFEGSPTSQDTGLVATESILLVVPQPYANHNGGMMAFGPDGYLYIGLGDGGNGGDPGNRAQDSTTLLGKILRIDVNVPSGYAIPPSNPFVGRPAWREEIWALGVRNPWRFSFDRQSGDMYIGDVGQGSWEEIDFEPSSSAGGSNYGWRRKEGDHCYNPSTNCEVGFTLVDPVEEYSHTFGCSVTGGYVYRGCAIPDLVGTYFFGDYCTGRIWSFRYDGTTLTDSTERTSELDPGSLNISSFGEDWNGELYIVHYGGTIYKIVPNGVPSACGATSCCIGTTGNVNLAGGEDLSDLSTLIAYFTASPRPTLPCPAEADINTVSPIDLSDLSLLINYLVGGGATFPACP
jgi:glucose/arabinose dehydrogenase